MGMKLINQNKAVALLNKGALIIYPTDTVYGIGCRADNNEAVAKLLSLKPRKTGFIILCKDWNEAQKWTIENIPQETKQTTRPTTWIFQAQSNVPLKLCNEAHEIAIRVPNYEPLNQLLTAIDSPIISTSANKPGEHTAQTPEELKTLNFPVLEGRIGNKPPSTIIHHRDQTIIRP